METRIALIGIIVENPESIEALNHLLHEYGKYIIGRMGIPYREREVNIISVAIDAPQDVINALSGKIVGWNRSQNRLLKYHREKINTQK